MKTAILYDSNHHGNTRKVVQAVAEAYEEVALFDLAEKPSVNFGAYQCIGLASGIAFGKLYDSVLEISEKIPAGKKVIILYTAGTDKKDYAKNLRDSLKERGVNVLGSFHCKGYDTFGILGKIGGINKKSPNVGDLTAAVDFYSKMREK